MHESAVAHAPSRDVVALVDRLWRISPQPAAHRITHLHDPSLLADGLNVEAKPIPRGVKLTQSRADPLKRLSRLQGQFGRAVELTGVTRAVVIQHEVLWRRGHWVSEVSRSCDGLCVCRLPLGAGGVGRYRSS
jgi:hypothetical protein